MRRILLALPCCLLVFSSCRMAPSRPAAHVPLELPSRYVTWLEIGPNGARIARAITKEAACPPLLLDGLPIAMTERVGPSEAFPVRVCETVVSPKARTATVAEQRLPLPADRVSHVIALGDTGCRAKISHGYANVQNCNDPDAWPFARVAAGAAARRPDLLIHVGDYLYRELEVPGQPFGDQLDTWLADFFIPVLPVLRAAPWIFVRGNHEDCARGGEGWRRFLDPLPYTATCPAVEPFYSARVGGVDVAVLDTSASKDSQSDPALVAELTRQLKAIDRLPFRHALLATHKPLWNGAVPDNDLNQATPGVKLRRFDAVLVGHAHFFGAVLFESLPAEFVTGNGGTSLSALPAKSLDDVKAGGRTIRHGLFLGNFGFLELESRKPQAPWHVIEHDAFGAPQLLCDLKDAVLCKVPR